MIQGYDKRVIHTLDAQSMRTGEGDAQNLCTSSSQWERLSKDDWLVTS